MQQTSHFKLDTEGITLVVDVLKMSGSDSPPGFQSPTSVGSLPAPGFDQDVSLSPPQLVQVSSATAIMTSPDSPQLSQRGSSGRIVGGEGVGEWEEVGGRGVGKREVRVWR